jgi:hypothetical protein
MTTADEDVAEAEAAARRALGVCLYPKPGCGAHQRFDSAEDAQAWCDAHRAAHPDHRVEVWPGRIDDLAVVNPITRAMYAYMIGCNRRINAENDAILNDPDWGKLWVSPEFYEAVRERAANSPEMKLILNHIRPMTPMEAPPDERSDPRNQPIPIGLNRRGKGKRRH